MIKNKLKSSLKVMMTKNWKSNTIGSLREEASKNQSSHRMHFNETDPPSTLKKNNSFTIQKCMYNRLIGIAPPSAVTFDKYQIQGSQRKVVMQASDFAITQDRLNPYIIKHVLMQVSVHIQSFKAVLEIPQPYSTMKKHAREFLQHLNDVSAKIL